jgi:hypothetical protein
MTKICYAILRGIRKKSTIEKVNPAKSQRCKKSTLQKVNPAKSQPCKKSTIDTIWPPNVEITVTHDSRIASIPEETDIFEHPIPDPGYKL